jgi:hypothetical protein
MNCRDKEQKLFSHSNSNVACEEFLISKIELYSLQQHRTLFSPPRHHTALPDAIAQRTSAGVIVDVTF